MASTTIALKNPVRLDDKDPSSAIREIVIKEPTGGMYLDFGEPRILARNANGTCFWFEDKQAIKDYLNRCVDGPNGGHVLRLMSIADVRAAREALFGFFSDTAPTTSETS